MKAGAKLSEQIGKGFEPLSGGSAAAAATLQQFYLLVLLSNICSDAYWGTRSHSRRPARVRRRLP